MDTIRYQTSTDGIQAIQLQGFFVGWPNPPSRVTHLKMLEQSSEVVLAIDEGTGVVVGFVTALTDGVLAAYIPLLEVLPSHQGRGVGKSLMKEMLARLSHLYMLDVMCDPNVQPFYAALGMQPGTGMMLRRYANQAGAGHGEPGAG